MLLQNCRFTSHRIVAFTCIERHRYPVTVALLVGLALTAPLSLAEETARPRLRDLGIATGILVTAKALLDREPDPSRQQIKEALSGNLCRCTGYLQIFESVEEAARLMREGNGGSHDG